MKKQVFFAFILLAMGCMMSSCKQEVVNNTNWQIVDCNIGYSQWRYTGDEGGAQYANHYYYAGYNISQLSSFIFTDGNVQAYLIEKNSAGENTQRPLPFSRHHETWVGDQKYVYTETYDYFYGIGWIEFNYTASDFAYEDSHGTAPDCHPDGKQFRVVLTW